MKSLPHEIYLNIFDYLPKSAIEQCLYVNQTWHQYAAQAFYNTIVLMNNHKEFLEALLSSKNGYCIGRWVEKVILKQGKSLIPLDKSEFRQVIVCLPYLKKIEFNNRGYALACLQSLLDIEIDYVPCLEDIVLSIPNIEDDSALFYWYTEAMYKLSHNTTRLNLENFNTERFENSEQKLIDYISVFPNLKQLFISNTRISGIHNLNILNVLKASPDVQNFELRSYLNNTRCDLKTLSIDNGRSAPRHKNLRNLHLSIFTLEPPLLDYMMEHILPKYMKSCTLRIYGVAFNDWVNDKEFSQSIYKFADYLRHFRNLNLCLASTLGGRPVIHTNPKDLLKVSTNTLWRFVNSIRGDRNLFGDALIDLDNIRYNHLKPLINVKDNQSLKLWISLSYLDQDVCRSHNNDALMYDWDSYFNAGNQQQLIGFSFINRLHINHRSFDVSDSQGVSQLFICLMKQCHWLKYLYFEGKDNSMLFGPIPIKSYDSHFEYKEAQRLDYAPVEKNTKDNFKYGSIQHMFISEPLMQAMLPQLPQLQILHLSRCTFVKQDETNCYLVPLGKISHLSRLELVLNVPVEYQLYFKIEMKNDMTVIYDCKGGKLIENSIEIHHTSHIDSHNNYTTYIIQCPKIDTLSIKVPSLTEAELISVEVSPSLDCNIYSA